MSSTNHYICLKKYLKRGYRKTISEATGASISLINKVLRGDVEDSKGIIPEAYRIANDVKKKLEENQKNLQFQQKKFAS